MTDDERAVRDLVSAWHRASRAGDDEALRPLMADDVVFLVAGRPPMFKDEFLRLHAAGGPPVDLGIDFEIFDLTVHGSWAHFWSRLAVTVTPAGGPAVRRSGHTLTLFRKEPDGHWVLARDANLLTVDKGD